MQQPSQFKVNGVMTSGDGAKPGKGAFVRVARRQERDGVLGLLWLYLLAGVVGLMVWAAQARAEITPFVGSYTGKANYQAIDGKFHDRDMSVQIAKTREGFTVEWTSTTYKENGRSKTKTYAISFSPSERADIYSAAMERNLFGHSVQLDPMKGLPYVWARIHEDTLTIFSLYIYENGDYEMQQYDRTLAEGGLELHFTSNRNGVEMREVVTFLKRVE